VDSNVTVDSHGAPEPTGYCVIARVRYFVPVPHDTEHSVYDDQSLRTQSTLHGDVLHGCISVSFTPEPQAPVTTLRVRVRVPLPQPKEQDDHDDHGETPHAAVQSTAARIVALHGAVLQAPTSVSAPQGTPPFAEGVTTVRVRDCVPFPHCTEHGDHTVQLLTTQSTGHGDVLHRCTSTVPLQAAPPLAAGVSTVRVRFQKPPPQVALHDENAVQLDMTQSCGHGWVLHGWNAVSAGHAMPPFLGVVMIVRVRFVAPNAPQV
jgi:hypothetical protein